MRQFVNILYFAISILIGPLHTNAQFVESSKQLGIDHISINPNLIGGGVVSFDYNNDGWQDLYFTSGINKDVLYKNINGEEFEIVDIPELSFTGRFNTSGAISADFNNDGCDDLFVTTLSIDPNLLFINNCDGSFALEFLHILDSDGEHVSSSGAFGSDFNKDGLLDIYLINYVKEHNFLEDSSGRIIGYDHDCFTNSVLINQGEFKFEQRLESNLIGNQGCSLAGSSSRFLDEESNGAYIVNDFGEWIYPNELRDDNYNSSIGLEAAIYGMGIAVSDFDNDEDYDIYLTNIGKNKLLINNDNQFINEGELYGVENELINDTTSVVSWGTMFLDFDNDSKLDLFVSNGYVPVPEFLSSSIVNQNKLFRNDKNVFTDITEVSGLASNGIHRGAILTDINNDGLLDIITSVVASEDLGVNDIKRSKVFVNQFNSDNTFLEIHLEGEISNRDGYNAEAKVYVDSSVYSQILLSGTSYASQSLSALHFGLDDVEMVDSIKIIWPSGMISHFDNVESNQRLLIRELSDRPLLLGCMDEDAENYSNAAEVNFGCASTTSTATKEINADEIKVFPNPSKGELNIQIDKAKDKTVDLIQIYDGLGQKVTSKVITKNSVKIKMNLGSLTAGSYVVQLISSDGKSISKLVQLTD